LSKLNTIPYHIILSRTTQRWTWVNISVQCRGKKHRLVVEVESLASSWKKNTTRRREGVSVVVEKNEESRRTFNKNSCDLFTAI